MSHKIEERLARAALTLRGAAPAHWDDFLRAMNDYREEADTAVVEAPPERLQTAQGYAQQLRILLRVLMNAPTLVQKYDSAKKV